MGEAATGMTNLLAAATSLFTWVFTNLATVATTIMAEGNSILLLGFLVSLVGLVVGIFKRLANIG